jgi:gliding motility-associated-like protein
MLTTLSNLSSVFCIIFLIICISINSSAHSVQLAYSSNCNGDLRLYVEHWHGTEDPSTTTMTLELTVNGTTSNINSTPGGAILNTPLTGLPTPATPFASCPLKANQYEDWVYYDFPTVPCGVPFTLQILSGNTVFTQDCGGMLPATLSMTRSCTAQQLPNDTLCNGSNYDGLTFYQQTGVTYSWTNSNPAIGLPASGTGDIPPFTAVNNTGSDIVANISFSNNICPIGGTFSIIVEPNTPPDLVTNDPNACAPAIIDLTDSLITAGTGQVFQLTYWYDAACTYPIPNPSSINTAGTYYIKNSPLNSGCYAVEPVVVNLGTPGTLNINNPSPICGNGIVDLTDVSIITGSSGVHSFTYWNDLAATDSINDPTSVDSSGTYYIQAESTSGSGCTVIQPVIVSVTPAPTANFSFQDICENGTVALTDLTSSTDPITQWEWEILGLPITSNLQNPSLMIDTSGSFVIQLVAGTQTNCNDTARDTIEVFALPEPAFTSNTACANDTIYFTNISTVAVGDTINSITWTFDGIHNSNLQNPKHVFSTPGIKPVELTLVSDKGCSARDSVSIEVFGQPTLDFSHLGTCQGDSTHLQANVIPYSALDPIQNTNWTIQNQIYNGMNTGWYNTNFGNLNVVFIAETNNGCIDSITKTIYINEQPQPDFTTKDSCLSDIIDFVDNSNISNGQIVSWSWDFGDNNTSAIQNTTHQYLAHGAFNVQLSVISDSGCTDSIIQQKNIHPNPIASFTSQDDCLYDSASFINTSTVLTGNIIKNEWTFGNAQTSNLVKPKHLYNVAGLYGVSLTTTSDMGCLDVFIDTIERFHVPLADFSFLEQCLYDSVYFTNQSLIGGSATITNYTWEIDGIAHSTQMNTENLFNIQGLHTVKLTAISNSGCKDDTSMQLIAHDVPVADFISDTVCEGLETSFTDQSTLNGNDKIVIWKWNDNASFNSSIQYPSYAFSAGNHDVILIAETDFGCIDTIQKSILIWNNPTASIHPDTSTFCAPYCVNFEAINIEGDASISKHYWDFGNGEYGDKVNVNSCFDNLNYVNPEFYSIGYTVIDENGCMDTIVESNFIQVNPNPYADFEMNTGITDIHSPTIHMENTSIGSDFLSWSLGDGSIDSVDYVEHSYLDSGLYHIDLEVKNIYGCVSNIRKPLTVKPISNIFVPNAFTPDANGVNDGFIFTGYGIVEEDLEFIIVNRWGDIVYQTNSFTPWDGRINGEPAKFDVYVYKINYKDVLNKYHKVIGEVVLVR